MSIQKKLTTGFLAVFLAIALFMSLVPIYPLSVSVSAANGELPVVYVSPNGADSGSGTKQSPFATLSKAYSTLSNYGGGTVVLMGDIESSNAKAWNNAKTAWGGAAQTGLLKITAKDPETGEIYPNAMLRYDAIGLLGDTTLEYVTLVPARTSCFVNSCGYKFVIGESVSASAYTFNIHDGIGETKRGNVTSTNTTVDGGAVNTIFVGGGYATNTSQGVLGDCNLTVNSGEIGTVVLGFDAYASNHTNASINGNIKITVNGGTIGAIETRRINGSVGGYISIILNNSTITSYELPNAEEGSFVIRSGLHGHVETTDRAGVFNVIPDVGYTAYMDGTEIQAGEITLLPGTECNIKYKRSDSIAPEALEIAYANGYSDGSFAPDAALSRAEAIGIITECSTDFSSIDGKYDSSFGDVSRSDWYYSQTAYCEYIGVLPPEWLNEGVLNPDDDITRGEFVYIIECLMPRIATSVKLLSFSDVNSDNPYYRLIMNAANSGCINGRENGKFFPDSPITRAETVTIINRYLERTPNGSAVSEFTDTAGHWAEKQIAAAASDLADGMWEFNSAGTKYVLPAPGSGAENYVKSLYVQSAELSGEAIRSGIDDISEQMKKDILYTPDNVNVTGTRFYVSEKSGDDKNDGKSPSTPVKTIARITTLGLKNGDAVLFERGGIYRGTISGTPGITYAAYGTGDKPLIMQSKHDYADPKYWEETEYPNVYKCTELLVNVGVIGFDHDLFDYSDSSYNEVYGKIMNKDMFGFTGPADLSEDLQFYSVLPNNNVTEAGELYLYSEEGNPGSRFGSIEIGERINIFKGALSNCVIDNLAFKFTGAHAVGTGGVTNLTVKNCVFSWLGGSVLSISFGSSGRPVNYGNAVEVYGSCHGYLVENNWMYQIYDTGVTHQYSDGSACIHEGVRYYDNLIELCHWGIEFYNNPGDGTTDPSKKYTRDVHIAYNVVRDSGYGWGSITRFRQTNSFGYCGSSLSTNDDELTEYNIFDRCAGYLVYLVKASNEVDDSNIYVQDIGRRLGLLKGVTKSCSYNAAEDIKKYFGDENAVTVVIDE